MKKLIIAVACTLISAGLFAQITNGGNFLMGSSIGFSTSNSEVSVIGDGVSVEGKSTEALQFNIAPKIGYFVTDNWALGVGLDYTLSRIKEPVNILDPNTEYNTSYDSDLLFGPFTRFYLPISEDKAFFVEATFGFGSSRDEIEINNEDQISSNNVLAFGIGPGFTIFSNDAIGIEALAKYNWARSESDIDFQGVRSETTNRTNAIDFSIGFQFYFSRVASASIGDTTNPAPANNTTRRGFY